MDPSDRLQFDPVTAAGHHLHCYLDGYYVARITLYADHCGNDGRGFARLTVRSQDRPWEVVRIWSQPEEHRMDNKFADMCGHMAAMRIVLGAMVATHPEPAKLRAAIASLTAAESSGIAVAGESSELKLAYKEALDQLLRVFLALVPKGQ